MAATATVVICGAGIAGVALAHQLAVTHGWRDVVLVEAGDPLALTSDKSTECYRNWWPDAAMVGLMNRSIDRIEEWALASANRIRLNRRGYLYATADERRVAQWQAQAEQAARHGAGPFRIHDRADADYQPASGHDWRAAPDGADLLLDPELIRRHFPSLNPATVAVLHTRRCGWLSAQQLGTMLLEEARAAGVTLVRGQVTAVAQTGGRVNGVTIATAGGTQQIATPRFVNAAGPHLAAVGELLGVELPVHNQLHLKAAFADPLGVVPRTAPLLIWADPVQLDWSADERDELLADPATAWLAGPLPAGVHCRPEGEGNSQQVLVLWDYHPHDPDLRAARFPLPLDDSFFEIALRGMATMLPGLRAYRDRLPRAYLDGGYYTCTPENRPLIGPLPVEGAFVIGALAGYGIMAAAAAAELLAAHMTGAPLPAYAAAFHPARYADPAYRAQLAHWGETGQL
ncbi:FAD-dependent oxidoreductase [Chloroflexus islandicus]|uniref:FAD-dependent oxidoreductase n=1 Tax=Chloroflexus islandicus TaxID=1707952 RepID=A0A178MI61_9CHLR|nr:FAD-dependent oxidoreductase [Chloroflexus islandicus]OAN48392.1 FAD-dependent oxidoreductase [Chloroflexus islandicus]